MDPELGPRPTNVPIAFPEDRYEGLRERAYKRRTSMAQLVREAGAHVEHILDKLGFASRTQIGVWAVQHGLVAPGPS